MRILDNLNLVKNQKKQKRKKWLLVFASLVILLLVLFYWLLCCSGYWLVRDDSFTHVSWAVVLDGQTAEMERTDFVSDLLDSNKVDSVLVLGRRVFRDKSNADYYAEDMLRTGTLDSGRIFLWRHNDPSTIEEALSIIPWFKKRTADTVLLITSAPASRRVAHLFNTLAEGAPVFITADIKHFTYNPSRWIQEREIRKLWFREMLAAILAKWDLLWVNPKDVLRNDVREIQSIQEENKEILVPSFKPSFEPPKQDSSKNLDTLSVLKELPLEAKPDTLKKENP